MYSKTDPQHKIQSGMLAEQYVRHSTLDRLVILKFESNPTCWGPKKVKIAFHLIAQIYAWSSFVTYHYCWKRALIQTIFCGTR